MARELYRKEVDAIETASKNKGELQMTANLKYKRALEIAIQITEQILDATSR